MYLARLKISLNHQVKRKANSTAVKKNYQQEIWITTGGENLAGVRQDVTQYY